MGTYLFNLFLFFELVYTVLWDGSLGRRWFLLFHLLYGEARKMLLLILRNFETWRLSDCDGLKRFAAHARLACLLGVASTENGFFTKCLKPLGIPYVPENSRVLSQVVGVHSAFCFVSFLSVKFPIYPCSTITWATLQLDDSIILTEHNLGNYLNKLVVLPRFNFFLLISSVTIPRLLQCAHFF